SYSPIFHPFHSLFNFFDLLSTFLLNLLPSNSTFIVPAHPSSFSLKFPPSSLNFQRSRSTFSIPAQLSAFLAQLSAFLARLSLVLVRFSLALARSQTFYPRYVSFSSCSSNRTG